MEQYETVVQAIALTMGVSWASGINLYAAVLVLGLSGAMGYTELPESLHVLQNPMVIAVAGGLFCVEFFADKIPGVDTAWDGIQTFVRIPAGALLAANVMGDYGFATELAAGAVGGGIAATSHATKAGSRVMINASPEPFSNWFLSLGEDVAVVVGLWTALNHPVVMITLIILFLIFAAWFLPKIWRGVCVIFRKLGELFGVARQPVAPADEGKPQWDPTDQLSRLRELRDDGTLTQEEFDQAKARLLDKN